MLKPISRAALVACILGVPALAQAPQSTVTKQVDPSLMRLRYASFDPLAGLPEVPAALRSTDRQGLEIVQFHSVPTQADRDAIAQVGGEVIGYLPDNAYVVRMQAAQVEALNFASVRWVGDYHPAFRLDPDLIVGQVISQPAPVRYNVVVANKHIDKPGLMAKVRALGGRVDHEQVGSLLIEVTLTGPQLAAVAALDEVLWIDRWSAPEIDMDNARIQGGGNYVETQAGYTGSGVNAHIYEGIEAGHPDFTGGATTVQSAGGARDHGHATAGIVWGNGSSNPAVRGMAPDCGKFYTEYQSVAASRWQVFEDLVDIWDVSLSSASWGNARTFNYTAISAESDDIVFDHDLTWTQSQSNAGNQDSRPQAWAKNVFSVGGVDHNDNSDPNDDSWQNGNASIGPASDGRIKPTMTAYYDNIGTSDLTGAAGYNTSPGAAGNWTATFGGTSGATPIVAGHGVLALQMFADDSATPGFGLFGNALRAPGGTTHENRPHFTTLKALMVVSGNQYPFIASSSDNRREHQGWGFPSVQNLYDNRDKMFIIDETRVLVQGAFDPWSISVGAGEPSLKMCLNWSEPAGNPAAAQQLVNNLSLFVTSPNGTTYWGNSDLDNGVWSTAGGSEDTINSIENVFIQNPTPGNWIVQIFANAVVIDNHLETPAVDVDYAFVVSGGTGGPTPPGLFAEVVSVGSGCGSTTCLDAIYEFPTFDLANSSFTLAWNGADYALSPGQGTWLPIAGQNLGMSDNSETSVNLGFTLPYPGGSTTTLRICANGWVTDTSFTGSSNSQPSVADFLQNTMWAALWRDLNPSAGGSVWYESTSTYSVVTWNALPNWPSNGSSTFQMQFWNNGDVHFLYQNITVSGDYLVGFTTAGVADPGSIDISQSLTAGLSICTMSVPNVALGVSARPIVGTVFDLVTTDAPPAGTFGMKILGTLEFDPAVDLTFLGMPGCELHNSLDALVLFVAISGTGTVTWPIPNDPTLAGAMVFAQSAVQVPGINAFDTVVSNGLRLTVGLN